MPKVLPGYKEFVKNKILNAAVGIFSLKGYYASTMSDIAKKLGISKATLYLYFRSKEEILKTISLSLNQKIGKILSKMLESDDFLKNEKETLSKIMEEARKHLNLSLQILSLASIDESIRKISREDREKGIRLIQPILQKKMDKGIIRNDFDSYLLGQFLIGFSWDIMIQTQTQEENAKIHKIWLYYLSNLLKK